MPSVEDSGSREFWDRHYQAGRMPWDRGGVPEALQRYLAAHPGEGRVLVPGCGMGYEIRAFSEADYDVVAIDFSPVAVEMARARLGPWGKFVQAGDFFTFDFGPAPFDLVYERTFLSAMPPPVWPQYARRMAELLRPKGLLAGFFFYSTEEGGPPFGLGRGQLVELFRGLFRPVADEPVTDSLPFFAGKERWQIWQRLPADSDTARAGAIATPNFDQFQCSQGGGSKREMD
ncbi:MAG: methyltransferase domain-containing protein [Acidobacteria bacterium]|nr:methyltransferase domain-containing protein [Acidobacteriota bacterium]